MGAGLFTGGCFRNLMVGLTPCFAVKACVRARLETFEVSAGQTPNTGMVNPSTIPLNRVGASSE